MSLISDALKEAQRERSGRRPDQIPPPLTGSVFPYPTHKKKERSAMIFIGGIGVAVVLAITAAVLLRGRAMQAKKNASVALTQPAPRTIIPPPAAVGPAAIPAGSATRGPAVNSSSLPVARPVAIAPRVAATAPDRPRSAPPTTTAPVTATATNRAATPKDPPQAATPSTGLTTRLLGAPSAAGNSGIRLILEPTGTRPADSLFKLAYAEHMRNNLDAARDLYEKSIQTQQAPAEAFNDYGALLVQRGDHVAAAEMFRQAIKRDDKNVEAWVNLGDSHKTSGHHADAMSAYARANQLDPTRATVKTRLAGEYDAIGDTATARRIFEDAVKTSPNDPSARYAYGAFLQTRGDYRGAIREFESFVDLAAGQFAPDFIIDIKRHIVTLRRVAP